MKEVRMRMSNKFKEEKKMTKGLPQFVNDNVLKILEKEEQTVVNIIECLTKKFRQTQLEWLDNWMEFREVDFDTEDDFFFTMKQIGVRKKKFKITDQELMMLQMLKTVKKRKRVEQFKHQILREVIKKEEGEKMADFFEENTKNERTLEAHYMGLESISRKRYD